VLNLYSALLYKYIYIKPVKPLMCWVSKCIPKQMRL